MKATKENFAIVANNNNRVELKQWWNNILPDKYTFEFVGSTYYGVSNGESFCVSIVKDTPIITLSEAKKLFEPETELEFPRMMYVWDEDGQVPEVFEIVEQPKYGYIAKSKSYPGLFCFWNNAKEIPPAKTKVTKAELMTVYCRNVPLKEMLKCYANHKGIKSENIEITE